ncbi:MAG: HDIG domain-containing protein [Treponema sp.]|jgi:putative nucleotidyltransferase with HDIG domain|nr:HDIG domain-containing protein [Treponema sp.]
MKKNKYQELLIRLRVLIHDTLRSGPFLAALGAFVVSLAIVLGYMNSGSDSINYDEFEVGRVAERDVIADYPVSYEDVEATRIKREAQERTVPAVFNYSTQITEEAKNNWNQFCALVNDQESATQEEFISAIQAGFPGYFSADILEYLYNSQERQEFLDQAAMVLDGIMGNGVFSMPQGAGLELLNPELVELIRSSGSRIERERIPIGSIVTQEQLPQAIDNWMNAVSAALEFYMPVIRILDSFIISNVFYSPDETAQRVAQVSANTDPVLKIIEQGQRIIRKGFIITKEEMIELEILTRLRSNDMRSIISRALRLLLLFIFLLFFCGKRIIDRNLRDSESYLVCILSVLYITGAVLARNFFQDTILPVSLIIPSALIVMLPAILIHPRLALLLAFTLPLAAFLGDAYDMPSFIFALVSGAAASFVVQNTEKRMDLVKAGLFIAGVNCAAMFALLLGFYADAGSYPALLFWAAFNGIASGMLVLGFLPPLEHALNAATSFRLVELSDLNSPVLRRRFTVAPGTYSHSIMVANLAESACQDIKANAALARVGAYYHDIGKMENPMYFVENQSEYNPHDAMDPKLSATVIRSHVKLGVEKARQLGLPREVIDIVAEHHGNSIITWFYSKALKQEDTDVKKAAVNVEDYSYTGNPPRSRESAVVMLADVAEAAVRSMDKPTPAKMEKFIQELFAAKVEHEQLSRSELTFRDLEKIKKAFVGVLTAYYHSRIEYPKIENIGNTEASQ